MNKPKKQVARFRIRGLECPVCGFETVVFGDPQPTFVKCANCGIEGPKTVSFDNIVTSTKVIEPYDPSKH